MSKVTIVDADASSIGKHGFCGFLNPASEGHRRKVAWLRKRFAEGLRFKILQVDGRDAGMIEYAPGEHAWRPVEAAGYMVIHCIMVQGKKVKGRGYGSMLIRECVKDARQAGMLGVAVVTSGGTWMASSDVFLRFGFRCVDTAQPSFSLLAKRFGKAPAPRFAGGWERKLRRFGSGMTIITSDQCPYIAKGLADILKACKALRIRPKLVELKSARQARGAPSAYGIFNIVHEGRLVADHPIGGTRFRGIVREL